MGLVKFGIGALVAAAGLCLVLFLWTQPLQDETEARCHAALRQNRDESRALREQWQHYKSLNSAIRYLIAGATLAGGLGIFFGLGKLERSNDVQ